jgi:ribosomal protein S18 acetylase RimI-like enzyme
MVLRIRPATRADADAIAALHLASYRAAYDGLLPAEVLSSLRAEERRRRWHVSLNDPQRQTLIAHNTDVAQAVIGFAEVGLSRDDDSEAGTGELMALHVMQSRWRQGTGRALHDTAVATLAARGFPVVTLWVLTGNSRARAFYEAMGWNYDGTARKQLAWGIQVPEVRYRCAYRSLGTRTPRSCGEARGPGRRRSMPGVPTASTAPEDHL